MNSANNSETEITMKIIIAVQKISGKPGLLNLNADFTLYKRVMTNGWIKNSAKLVEAKRLSTWIEVDSNFLKKEKRKGFIFYGLFSSS